MWIGVRRAVVLGGLVMPALAVPAARGQATAEIDREPIRYSTTPGCDAVARLQGRIERGEVTLAYDDDGQGYLKSVLAALKVPAESQMLVFSKTSFQQSRIAPGTPRAVYFGDDVYVGYVRGGDMLEFSAADPRLGATFYLLDQQEVGRPKFVRQTDACLQCHHSAKTQDVPGHLVRSVFTDSRGYPVFGAGSFATDHESPMSERWGGWYVTGTHGSQRHMGNVVVTDREHPDRLDTAAGSNRKDLKGLVDARAYLTPHSDIVALMVLEHQTQTQNRITRAGHQARLARYYDAGVNKALGRPDDAESPSTARRLDAQAEELVRFMLFTDEPKLTAPVAGTSGFTEVFPKPGPRDRKGRSLRDFDLKTRLFQYPCSYLVASEAFDALPQAVKERFYRRLLAVLTGRDTSPSFTRLTPADRRAILEILLDTKTDLPDEWRESVADLPTTLSGSRP